MSAIDMSFRVCLTLTFSSYSYSIKGNVVELSLMFRLCLSDRGNGTITA